MNKKVLLSSLLGAFIVLGSLSVTEAKGQLRSTLKIASQ
jgi:hypothetical protein